jgi:hypothetical protein
MGASAEGADMMTFLAPPFMWRDALPAWVVKTPVNSSTTWSAPASPHLMLAGSISPKRMVRTEQGFRFATPGAAPGEATDGVMDFIMSEEKSVAASVRSDPHVGIISPSKSSSEEEEAEDSVMSIVSKLINDVKSNAPVQQTNKLGQVCRTGLCRPQ